MILRCPSCRNTSLLKKEVEVKGPHVSNFLTCSGCGGSWLADTKETQQFLATSHRPKGVKRNEDA